MEGSKIAGIIIIIALILSLAFVGYNALTKKDKHENINQISEILDESQLNQTTTGEQNTTIQTVNLNIHQKVGSTKIIFSDNSQTIYNITSKNEKNKTTTITKQQNDTNLDVNIESDDAQNTIILSNKYHYNITANMVSGGFSTNISENAKIDKININLTAGGVDIKFNGGSLNTLNSRITTGGLNLIGEPKGETTINSEIEVGGLNIENKKAIADIFTDIEVGGINPGNYQKITEKEYKGNQFDSSENKLIINNNITLGGVNTQSFK